jgi:two-component system chemotaxis sensor kinase CheA
MSFDLSKYRDMFVEEAAELFTDIEEILLEAEEVGTIENEEINALFRAMHTIKGGAGSVELNYLQKFTHEVESFLDQIRNDKISYQSDMADLFMNANDAMKEILDAEVDENLEENEFKELTTSILEEIKSYQEQKGEIEQSSCDAFGFFDDETEQAVQMQDDESFGFFKHDDAQGAFGFFKNEEKSADKKLEEGVMAIVNDFSGVKAKNDSQAFGFFDSDEDDVGAPFGFFEPIDSSKPRQEVQKKTEKKDTKVKSVKSSKKSGSKKNSSIRVDLSRVDKLMNNIGELVISSSMLYPIAHSLTDQKQKEQMLERLDKIESDIRELQESVLSVRMVPMEDIYSKFPKLIRDVGKKLGKKIEFKTSGGSVEIDKAMTEGIIDPLMHIVRNSMDHGLETPEIRKAAGKPESGTVRMQAEQGNGQIIISIKDDGAGVNVEKVTKKALENGIVTNEEVEDMNEDQKAALIFAAGLSTADQVSDLSGRGVGMDVVKSNINKLGGVVNIHTERGVGTTISIVLPLTLAIMDGLNISVGQTRFILPLASIVESLQPTKDMIKVVGDGTQELLMLRDEFIPIVKLYKIFNVEPRYDTLLQGMLIVVKAGDSKIALFIDEFLNQQQVVIKPLDKNFKNIKGVSGATVREDGSIGLILDIIGIVDQYKLNKEVA